MPACAAAEGTPRRGPKEPVQSLAVRKGSFHPVFQHSTNRSQKKPRFEVTLTSQLLTTQSSKITRGGIEGKLENKNNNKKPF